MKAISRVYFSPGSMSGLDMEAISLLLVHLERLDIEAKSLLVVQLV